MKKAVLILSKNFPTTHSRHGHPTLFRQSVQEGKKIHTIRAVNGESSRWKKTAEEINSGKKVLSVREWTGRPYNSKMSEIFSFNKIGIQDVAICSSKGIQTAHVDGRAVPLEELAKNDGLDVGDFLEFFFGKKKEGTFKGVVIHFTDFRY